MRQRLNLLGTVSLAGAILYLSVIPLSVGPGGTSVLPLSLLKHAVTYFALAAALLVYFHDTRRGHLEAIAVASLFGLGIELVQLNLPYRFFGYADIAANTLGASIIMLDHRSRLVTKFIEIEDGLIEETLERGQHF